MFAIDLVDNPVKELFPTFTVFTQFEKTSLAFLNILAKCDLWRKWPSKDHVESSLEYFKVARCTPNDILSYLIGSRPVIVYPI